MDTVFMLVVYGLLVLFGIIAVSLNIKQKLNESREKAKKHELHVLHSTINIVNTNISRIVDHYKVPADSVVKGINATKVSDEGDIFMEDRNLKFTIPTPLQEELISDVSYNVPSKHITITVEGTVSDYEVKACSHLYYATVTSVYKSKTGKFQDAFKDKSQD